MKGDLRRLGEFGEVRHLGDQAPYLLKQAQAVVPHRLVLVHHQDRVEEQVHRLGESDH